MTEKIKTAVFVVTAKILLALLLTWILMSSASEKSVSNSDVVVLTPTSLGQAKSQIDLFTSKGYRVKHIAPENVSTSVNSRNNTTKAYDSQYRDLKGGFLIVMERSR